MARIEKVQMKTARTEATSGTITSRSTTKWPLRYWWIMYEQMPMRITAKNHCNRRVSQVAVLASPDTIVVVVVNG